MCCIANYPLSLGISVNSLPANCLSYLSVTCICVTKLIASHASILLSELNIQHSAHYTLYSLLFTPFSTLYSVLFALYAIPYSPSPLNLT